jgi:pimeloyl-ACP methyl ester carboxylesterase
MEKEILTVDYKGHKIIGDIMPAGALPKVLCLHGGGGSNRKRYDQIRKLLSQNNISTCALDFLGHGDTGGEIENSSLKDRTEQASVIIKKAKVVQPLSIIGSSMSAFTAIKLTEIHPVSLLVLIVPAVYSKDSYNIPFGDSFSQLIRKEGRWNDTDAFGILNQYKGDLIIVVAGKDEVIPPEIIKKIYDNALNAKSRKIITFPDAPHKIMGAYFNEHPEDLKIVVNKIIELMK